MEKWESSEIEELKHFYKATKVSSDRLVKDKPLLEQFVTDFNNRLSSGRSFRPKEVADQLFKLRKGGKLPRIRDGEI